MNLPAAFHHASVYIGFSFFMLPKNRPGQLSSMPWGESGSVMCLANRPACVQARPAPPGPAPPCRLLPCAAPPRTARDISGFWTRQVEISITGDSYSTFGGAEVEEPPPHPFYASHKSINRKPKICYAILLEYLHEVAYSAPSKSREQTRATVCLLLL